MEKPLTLSSPRKRGEENCILFGSVTYLMTGLMNDFKFPCPLRLSSDTRRLNAAAGDSRPLIGRF